MKDSVEAVSDFLSKNNISFGSFHGGMDQKDRERSLIKFRNGTYQVIVATDLAARGIDIPEVEFVYNFDLPNVPENYVHRIGRTARAGASGIAIAFCAMPEMKDLIAIEKKLNSKLPSN